MNIDRAVMALAGTLVLLGVEGAVEAWTSGGVDPPS